MQKVFKFIRSMKFALILLILLLIACVIGSVQSSYDVYHSWWFIVLALALCISLVACNLSHVSSLTGHKFSSEGMRSAEPDAVISQDPEKLFADLGFKGQNDSDERYAVRNKIGIWGAWLTHLGILVIILGFGLGEIFTVEYSAYGVAGQTKNVEGTSYSLTIDTFETILRDDDTVDQYTSTVTMTNTETLETQSGTVSVNHPCNLFGMKLYQNSTGWAADIDVYYQDELIQHEIVCAGEYMMTYGFEDLIVMFNAFYPDYDPQTMSSASARLNNPAYVYTLYYGENILGMNVLDNGDDITVDDFTYKFSNPRQYSLITIKHDPFTWLALIGGIIILCALFVAFYMRTEEILAVNEEGKWYIYGRSRKGGILFKDKIAEEAKKYE